MPAPSRLLLLIFASLLAVSGISAQEQPRQYLTIYAATSLTDVFEALEVAYLENHPETEILLNFASSSTLAAQINAGAPADIFASANETQMSLVVDAERINQDDVHIFAHNQLVLILPADNPAEIESMADLANESILLVLAAEGTPIRAYTDAMLVSYNEEYGQDFSERVLRNLVSEESNVRQVTTRIALGEADAGIVYQTDAMGDLGQQLITLPISAEHNQLASYLIAMLSDSSNASAAAGFIDFLLSEAARDILIEYGFCSPAILDDVPLTDVRLEPTREAEDNPAAESSPCQAQPVED